MTSVTQKVAQCLDLRLPHGYSLGAGRWMDHCVNSEVTELGDWQQCSVKLMEAGQLPKGWCNTTGTYVQTTQHTRHTYALGSWSGEVLQKTSSNWTWVQTKRLSEERIEEDRISCCLSVCVEDVCWLFEFIYTLKTFIPVVFAALWVCILSKICATF